MPSGSISKTQVLAACGEIFLFTVLGYYALKFIVNVLDPTNKQKAEAKNLAQKLMESIGVKDVILNDHEMMVATSLVDPSSISVSWDNIGGLDELIREMKESVVLPFTKKELFTKSLLLCPPKGVLLYGPPGCGKTMVAKATAKEAGCRFINLDVSSLTDKWYGESQKLANAVFSLARKIQPCIIFIDEIDSFLRSRSSTDHEATAMMKAQFMSLWDGLMSQHSQNDVIIVGATNRPQDVDKAILRRMPCRFFVSMPDQNQRHEILQLILQGEELEEDVDLEELAKMTEKCSGSDLKELCRLAALNCIRDVSHHAISSGNALDEEMRADIRAINMNDFNHSLQRMYNSHNLLASHGLYNS